MKGLIAFSTFKVFSWISHFIATTCLYWTRYPSVQIILGPDYSDSLYLAQESSYMSVISLGLIFLIFQGLALPFEQNKLHILSVLGCALDLSAIFFIIWIVLDGLAWTTYSYIFCSCV
jgi:hypothetical protein